jgi:exopolysaccharide biosynthesis polyprenyl glycosylphosphotransferase
LQSQHRTDKTNNAPWVSTRSQRRELIRVALITTDVVALTGAALAASFMTVGNLLSPVHLGETVMAVNHLQLALFITPLLMLSMSFGQLYDLDKLSWGSGEFSNVAKALSLGVVGIIMVWFALALPPLPREWILLLWSLAVLAVCVGRYLTRLAVIALSVKGRIASPTLIVGTDYAAGDIARVLLKDRASGLVPVGCLASSRKDRLSLDYCSPEVPELGHAADLLKVIERHEIDTVIMVSSAFDHEVLSRMIAELKGVPVDVHISSSLSEVLPSRVWIREVAGMPLISLKGVSFTPWHMALKRSFDIAVASFVTLLGLPAWLTLAGLVKVTSPGPVFYRQERVGKGGETFKMYKFRTMVVDADKRMAELREQNEADGPIFKIKHDPRVTSVGRWMRKFSLDEFPQLLNVLKGEMSLVGPRPPLPSEADAYTERHWRRLEVLPGMTGLWQVSGRSDLTFEEMIRLDLYYIQNWSVRFDVTMLLRTVPAVLVSKGAY